MYIEKESQSTVTRKVSCPEFVPQGDTISSETIVNILVKKGICTVNEIFAEEGRIRDKNEKLKQEEYKKIREISNHHYHHNRNHYHSKIKRLFSKRKWTRRLGTALFGWKWKKVKRSSDLN